ncbi:MAG: TonB-dependent receptor [Candidatus Marinimicrobia bacterium]|nr:TonB-dependent receptor [Candidatus Neomarinimicrobiota bacterium]
MIKNIIISLIIISYSLLNAGQVIMGYVINSANQEPLPDVNIVVVNQEIGSSTDSYGFFQIELPELISEIFIEATAVGFSKVEKKITKNDLKNTLVFELQSEIIELNPITVIKNITRLDNDFLRPPGSIDLVSFSDLKRYNDTDINRILSRIPGIYVQEEDGFGLRPNIGMRGTGVERSSKINIMEDGIPISPAPYASPAAYYSPTAGRMHALEARKGSSQIKYGPHSTGGSINYVSTPIPSNSKSNLNLLGGTNNAYTIKANVGKSSKSFGYLFEILHDENDGFKKIDFSNNKTGYSKTDLMAKVRYQSNLMKLFPNAIELKFSSTNELSDETYLGLTENDYSIDPYRRYSSSQNDQMKADHMQFSLTNSIQLNKNSNLALVIYRNNFKRNWYKLSKVNGASISSLLSEGNSHKSYSYLSAKDTEDDTYEIKANNRKYYSQGIQIVSNLKPNFLPNHNLMIGLRIHEDQMDRFQKIDKYGMQNSILNLTTNGLWGVGSKNNRLDDAISSAFFIEDQFSFRKFIITAGIRYESIELTRNDWKGDISLQNLSWNDPERVLDPTKKIKSIKVLVPGAGFVYQLNPNVQILAGIHKGYSPPGPGKDDSEDIKPEESINLETGFIIKDGLNKVRTVLFNNSYSNLLGDDTQFAGEGSYDQFNAGKVNINGLEFAISRIFKRGNILVPVEFNYTFTSSEFLSTFESSFEAWGSVNKGDELPYLPKHQMFAEIGIIARDMRFYMKLNNVSQMRTKAGTGVIDDKYATQELTQIDISGEYNLTSQLNLFFSIKNLTNSKAIVSRRPAGLRPTMPKTFSAGIKLNF